MNTDKTMHIVLPLADLRSARAAFPVARAMARILDAPLHVLAAGDQLAAVQDFARQGPLPPDEHDRLVIEAVPGDLVEATMREVAASREAIVVLALRLQDALTENAPQPADTVGRQVLEKITCPILLVPLEQDMSCWQLRRELLPQDGTPSCAVALAQLVRHSSRMGVENLVLRVAGANVGQPTEPGSLPTPRYVDHPEYEWEAWGQEFLERVHGMGVSPGTAGMRLLMANGDPATEILRVAEEKAVDLIILPWHGILRSGRARMVKAVLRRACCPVLLVPQRSERRSRQR